MSILQTAATEPGGSPAAATPFVIASVLVIDDEETVCNSLSALLKADGFDAATARSGKEGMELLRARPFDVVIADLVMPGMDGIQTAAALKAVDPDIEVIILTGRATLELAIAALRQGACDFLRKPVPWGPLRHSLLRALEKRRGKAGRRAALASAVMGTAQEAIVLFNREGVVWEFNPVAEKIFGISRQQAVGRNFTNFAIPPRLIDVFRRHLEAAYREGKDPLDGCLEVSALRQNGEEFPLEISTAVIETPQGKLLSAFARDITERKHAEQAIHDREAKLQVIFEGVETGIFLIDPESHRIVDANPLALKLVGASRDHVVGAVCHKFVCPAEVGRCPVTALGQTVDNAERVLLTPAGGRLPIIKTVRPVVIDGRPLLLETFVDIAARKQAEGALRESEERYRVLYESSHDAIMMLAPPKWEFTAGNPAAIALFGAKNEQEFVAAAPWRLSPEYQPDGELSSVKASRMIAIAMEKGAHFFEWTHKKFSGEEFFATVTLTRMIYRGQPLLQGAVRDTTERKRAEATMAERHRLAALVAEVGVALTGAENMRQGLQRCAEILVRDVDAAFARVWTVNEDEKVLELQASAGMYTHIEGGHARVPMGKLKIGRIAESGEPHLTNSVQNDSWVGDPGWARREGMVAFAGYPLKVEERVLGVLAAFARQVLTEAAVQAFASVADNISQFIERIRAEEALRESEERYRTLFERNLAGVFRGLFRSRKLIDCNDAYAHILGYDSREEVLNYGKLHAFYDAAEAQNAQARLLNEKAVSNHEVRFRRKDQTPVWVLSSVSLIMPGESDDPLIEGTLIDITERKQAEEQTRLQTAALESAANGIAIADREGRILWINSAFTRLTGYSLEEVLGQTMRVLKSGEQDANFYQNLWQTILSGEVWRGELANRRKNGSLYIDETTITPVRDASGTLTHFVAIKQNVTARKQAERALEERTVYLNTLFEISPMGIVVLDIEGCIEMSNSAFERLFLYSHEEIVGANLDSFIVPEHLASEAKSMNALCQSGAGAQMTTRRRRKDGALVDVDIYGVPLVIEGNLRGILALYHDITERRRAEENLVKYAEDLEISQAAQEEHARELARLVEELAQERELLRALMDNLPDYIYFKDLQSRIIRTNLAHAKAFGLSDPAQVVGKTDFDFFTAEHAQQAYSDEQEVVNTGKPMMAKEEKETWPDGRETWVSTTKMPLRDANGAIIGTFGISHDFTQRMQAEETLRASEERYRELFENASDIVYTTGLDTRLTSLNRVGQQVLGYSAEEAIRLTLQQLVAPKHWEAIEHSREQLMAGESDITMEVEVTAKDGRPMTLEVKPRLIYQGGKPVGVQGIARDITGRDAAELELRHAQKLESVGRLASGIAHEINTPIQFVGDNTRFLQDSFGDLQALLTKYQELRDAAESGAIRPELLAEVHHVEETSDSAYLLEEIPKALSQTLDGVTRVATIVRAMKEFAHPQGEQMSGADLNKALQSTLTVARNELKYVADVETEFGELPLVVCNIGDLNQVFLNLLVNGAHAIGEVVKGTSGKGTIRVRTATEEKTVVIAISDTGAGIPEAIRNRIFDPFFTTKEVGRGTGQGLAIARSVVVERHKGTLTFETEVGKGTTFYVRLPIDPGEASKERTAS